MFGGDVGIKPTGVVGSAIISCYAGEIMSYILVYVSTAFVAGSTLGLSL